MQKALGKSVYRSFICSEDGFLKQEFIDSIKRKILAFESVIPLKVNFYKPIYTAIYHFCWRIVF